MSGSSQGHPKVQKHLNPSGLATTMRYVEDSTAGLREAQAKVADAMGLGVSLGSARISATSPKTGSGGKNGGEAKKLNPRKSK